jgi:alpha-L-fucosidase
VDIASKGGNYLLNIGPKGDGSVPEESVRSMRAIGAWMKVNGESIYGTTASLVAHLPWGRTTTKGRTIYLHVFEWPAGGTLNVPGLATRVKHARLLAGGAPVAATTTDAGLVLRLPATAPDPIASVVAVELEEEPRRQPAGHR